MKVRVKILNLIQICQYISIYNLSSNFCNLFFLKEKYYVSSNVRFINHIYETFIRSNDYI